MHLNGDDVTHYNFFIFLKEKCSDSTLVQGENNWCRKSLERGEVFKEAKRAAEMIAVFQQ